MNKAQAIQFEWLLFKFILGYIYIKMFFPSYYKQELTIYDGKFEFFNDYKIGSVPFQMLQK